MLEPIYFPSGHIEQLHLWDDSSHAEDQTWVGNLGAFMWGPLEDTNATTYTQAG